MVSPTDFDDGSLAAATVSTLLITFNCARFPVDPACLARGLFDALPEGAGPPDLVIFSLQEVAPIAYAFLGGAYLTPYLDRFADGLALAAPEIEYRNVVTRNVGMTALMVFAKEMTANQIVEVETAGVGVGVWEMGNKGAVAARLWMKTPGNAAHEGGQGGGGREEILESRDGGRIDMIELTLIAAHLAPMEASFEQRNQDWETIRRNTVFTSSQRHPKPAGSGDNQEAEETPLLATSPSTQPLRPSQTHTFVLGDLNYRTSDVSPSEESYHQYPQPHHSPSSLEHYSHLLERDQLTRERRAGRTLQGLDEARITFPPTYKHKTPPPIYKHQTPPGPSSWYDVWRGNSDGQRPEDNSDPRHSSDDQDQPSNSNSTQSLLADADPADHDRVWNWAPNRWPSWCDRILFRSTSMRLHRYMSLPVQPTSDHQPVALSCDLPFSSSDTVTYQERDQEDETPISTRPSHISHRAAARRRELLVGGLAWLVLTGEGWAAIFGIAAGTLGGVFMLKRLLSM